MFQKLISKSKILKISEDQKILAFVPLTCIDPAKIIPPNFQRLIDEKHVKKLASSMDTKNISFYGIFHLAVINANKILLIDGQHRLKSLLSNLDCDRNLDPEVLVCFHQCMDEEDAFNFMKIINSTLPLKLPFYKTDMEIMNELKNCLISHFKPFIKHSERPRVPNINLENLVGITKGTKFFQVIKTHDLETELMKINTFIGQQNIHTLAMWGLPIHKLEQTKKTSPPFYLGLYQKSEWIHHLIYHILSGTPLAKIEMICEKSKTLKIKKSIRTKLWISNFGEESRVGECTICSEKITENSFHAGHIISAYNGGSTCLSNLEPICKDCNLDMGVCDLRVYKSEFAKQNC